MDIKPGMMTGTHSKEIAGVNGVTDPMSLTRLGAVKDPKVRAEALAGQLESVFFGMMVKSMRDTVPNGGLLGKGLGGSNYVEMLDQQFTQMGNQPRDPRFHEALVRQILQAPEAASSALSRMDGPPAAASPANPIQLNKKA